MRISIKVLKRILIEFGPPLTFALLWIKFAPPNAYGALQFSAIFFAASWFWGQFLRILYQQTQIERIRDLGNDLGSVKASMETITRIVDEIRNRNVPELQPDIRHLVSAVGTANNQIEQANTTYQDIKPSNFVLLAETGNYRIKPWSDRITDREPPGGSHVIEKPRPLLHASTFALCSPTSL